MPDGRVPETAPWCDNYTLEGCRIGEIPANAVDDYGVGQCVCVKNCGPGSGILGD